MNNTFTIVKMQIQPSKLHVPVRISLAILRFRIYEGTREREQSYVFVQIGDSENVFSLYVHTRR